MKRAQRRDALRTEKFSFRQSVTSDERCSHHEMPSAKRQRMQRDAVRQFGAGCQPTEMTILEILLGDGKAYKGLVPMIMAYLHAVGADSHSLTTIEKYMDFIVARASGELMTPAAWIREFVHTHPEYKQDSVVSPKIAADLMSKCHRVGLGLERAPELHGAFTIAPIHVEEAYSAPLISDRTRDGEHPVLGDLVEHYTARAKLALTKRKLENEIGELSSKLGERREELRAVNHQMDLLHESQPPTLTHSPQAPQS